MLLIVLQVREGEREREGGGNERGWRREGGGGGREGEVGRGREGARGEEKETTDQTPPQKQNSDEAKILCAVLETDNHDQPATSSKWLTFIIHLHLMLNIIIQARVEGKT